MTYKEKLLHDYPESMVLGTIGKCPADYGYEPDADNCPKDVRSCCSVCWSREMPMTYPKEVRALIKAKTIAQYRILKWLEANEFYLPVFQLDVVDNDRIKLTDCTGESLVIVCDGEYVYPEEK